MKRIAWALVVAIALLGPASFARADDGPMYVVGNGASVRPMKNTSIRMAAETVQAICYQRFAEYRVDFRFENAEATQSVLLGFPFDAASSPPPYTGGDQFLASAGFRAWQDGKPLAVSLQHGVENYSDYDYYTHTADFAPGVTTITVDYLVAPSLRNRFDSTEVGDMTDNRLSSAPYPYADEPGMEGFYGYTLHTGSYWRGTIGLAVLRWTLSSDFIGWGISAANAEASTRYDGDTNDDGSSNVDASELLAERIQSAETTPTGHSFQWTLRDFKPRVTSDGDSPYDLGLYFYAPPTNSTADEPTSFHTPTAHASSWFDAGQYQYPASNLVDGDPSTAWAEGVRGSGVGQWVDVILPSKRPIRELRILPGYAKRPELFSRYSRPKTLRFDFTDGTSTTVHLADSPTLQRFPVEANAYRARMTILAVYPGSVRDETYVSEVEFGGAPAPTFEDPAALLASAARIPSADATPAPRTGASPSRAKPAAPKPAEPIGAMTWALLAASLAIAVIVIVALLP